MRSRTRWSLSSESRLEKFSFSNISVCRRSRSSLLLLSLSDFVLESWLLKRVIKGTSSSLSMKEFFVAFNREKDRRIFFLTTKREACLASLLFFTTRRDKPAWLV